MPFAIPAAVEAVARASSDVYDINKTIFRQGVGKVPHRFLVARGNVVEPIALPPYGATFHLASKIETRGGNRAVAHQYELPEERASALAGKVLHPVAAAHADDHASVRHRHVA